MPLFNKKEEEVTASSVGVPAKGKEKTTNKDGFVKGQEVSEKDYALYIAKQRLKK